LFCFVFTSQDLWADVAGSDFLVGVFLKDVCVLRHRRRESRPVVVFAISLPAAENNKYKRSLPLKTFTNQGNSIKRQRKRSKIKSILSCLNGTNLGQWLRVINSFNWNLKFGFDEKRIACRHFKLAYIKTTTI
jgi:hypothetical protein